MRGGIAVVLVVLGLGTASVLGGASHLGALAGGPGQDVGIGAAGASSDAAGASSEAPTVIPWELLDCTYAIAFASADRAKVEPHLPSGFTTTGAPTTVRGVTVPSVVNIGFEVNVCAEGAGLNGLVPDMTYASFWVAVDAPDHLEIEGEGSYFVNWDHLVPDAPRRDLLQAHGLPSRDGSVAITLTPGLADAATTWTTAWTVDGMGTFSGESAHAAFPAQSFDDSFVQFTEADDGRLARWRVDYQSDAASFRGFGTLHIDPSSWIAGLFEATDVPVTMLMGRWSYTDGTVELLLDP